MTSDFMKELLSKDEKITVEYKTCQYGIQEDVYETVCSFSNRYGGYIIMRSRDFRYLRCRVIPGALCLVMSGMCRLCACRDVCIIMKDIP